MFQLFCPNCQAYLGLSTDACICGFTRDVTDQPRAVDQPLWSTTLAAPCRSKPAIAGALVLFAWGDRRAGGGVTALHRRTDAPAWTVSAPHSVEAGVSIQGDWVYFATLGFPGSGGEAVCCRLADGVERWRAPVSGGAWSAPVVNGARVFIGCDDGSIHCLDHRSGAALNGWPVQLERGKVWLTWVEGALYALCASGKIHQLDLVHGKTPGQDWYAGGKITSPPAIWEKRLYFGLENSGLAVFDLQSKRFKQHGTSWGSIVAAPCLEGGLLFASSHDRCVHVLDLRTGQNPWAEHAGLCSHSISTTPALVEDLLVVDANDAKVHFFDATSGEPVWSFKLVEEKAILGSPAIDEGVVYLGAEDGRAYALPWHLGKYALAAQRLEKTDKLEQAAAYFALAGDLEVGDPDLRERWHHNASENWRKAGAPERAAYFQEALVYVSALEKARAFEQAGDTLSQSQHRLAANLLRRAVDWYEDASEHKAALKCQNKALLAAKAPYLSLHTDECIPGEWEAGAERCVAIEINNQSDLLARQVQVRFAGSSLARRVWLEMGDLPAHAQAELEMPLIAITSGNLQIEVVYQDAQNNHWSTGKRHEITVTNVTSIEVDGSVGFLQLYEQELRQKIHVRGNVGLLKVGFDAPASTEPLNG